MLHYLQEILVLRRQSLPDCHSEYNYNNIESLDYVVSDDGKELYLNDLVPSKEFIDLDNMYLHDEINNIIGEVFEEYKSLNKYYTYEEMQDVLATLNEKESTIKSQLHRARKMLETKLKGGYDFV